MSTSQNESKNEQISLTGKALRFINRALWTTAFITISITAGGSTLLAIYYTARGAVT